MICFAWSGFPQYAARCIGAFVATCKEECVVVATRPRVPVLGMEELCGCRVFWIDSEKEVNFSVLLSRVPKTLLVDGWATRPFNALRDLVRAHGGRVFAMVDNNFIFSFREFVKAVRFRLFLKHHYDGYLVPGKSSLKLLRFYGVSDQKVHNGMYAADEKLFFNAVPIERRDKKFLFVGQLCNRKNVVGLAECFLDIPRDVRREWRLEICGCGPDKERIPRDSAITVHDFVQPEELAKLYQTARVFVLPSKEEHWGLVVHEAALSGCVLLASRFVGAVEDFITEENGRVFDPSSRRNLQRALKWAMEIPDTTMKLASMASVDAAARISLKTFVEGVSSLIGDENERQS